MSVHRYQNEVCGTCKRHIEYGKQAEEDQRAASTNAELGDLWHVPTALAGPSAVGAVCDMVRAAGTRVHWSMQQDRSAKRFVPGDLSSSRIYRVQPDIIAAAIAAIKAIAQANTDAAQREKDAYQAGLERGRDLLGQLASGDITIGDFERGQKR